MRPQPGSRSYLRRQVRPHFAQRQLQTISPQVVQRWQNELEPAVGHETVMSCRSILFRIMEVAVKERLIPVNPVREVEAPKRPVDPDVVFGHAKLRTYTPEEAGQLLAALPAFWPDHFLAMLGTGLRAGELLGLRARRVDLERRRLEVIDVRYDAGRFGSGYKNRPKSDTSLRIIPLAGPVVDALARRLDGCPADGLVFSGPGGGNGIKAGSRTALSIGNLRRAYKRAAARAELHHLNLRGPHDLRHTFATWLEDGGIPTRVIDELMGHSGGTRREWGASWIGLRYRHTTDEMHQRVVAALDERLAVVLARVDQIRTEPPEQQPSNLADEARTGVDLG